MGTPGRTNGGTTKVPGDTRMPGSVHKAAMRDRGAAAGAGGTGGRCPKIAGPYRGVPGVSKAIPMGTERGGAPRVTRGEQGLTGGIEDCRGLPRPSKKLPGGAQGSREVLRIDRRVSEGCRVCPEGIEGSSTGWCPRGTGQCLHLDRYMR